MSEWTVADEEQILEWQDDPVRFVLDNFDTDPNEPLTIDPWQKKVLRDLKTDRRAAFVACKGPGKTCMESWLGWWLLACHTDSQGIACSITSDNLRDNLWKEFSKWWDRSEWLQRLFTVGRKRIYANERPDLWWLSARSFPRDANPEQQANTLAGLHAKVVFIILDELGDFPLGVLHAADAIFANEDQVAYIVAGGNPTNRKRALFHITTVDRDRWAVTHITGDPDDPMRSRRISVEWAQGLIDKFGRDAPHVMVNVLGLFPPGSSKQLIDVNWVMSAMDRNPKAAAFEDQPNVWGLDPGRFGDDEQVLARRQGICCMRMHSWRNVDGTELGNAVSHLLFESEKGGRPCDTLFVDVGGVGASAFDRIVVLGWGHVAVPVDFGGKAEDSVMHVNVRTEIWWRMAEWLKRMPASLPTDPVLQGELVEPEFDFTDATSAQQTRYVLESKKKMKSRGVDSPNRGDALALTFTTTVAPRSRMAQQKQEPVRKALTQYDPYTRDRDVYSSGPRALTEYDPLARR